MSRKVQVFNPTHNMKYGKERMNVMGRLLDKGVNHVAVLLDKKLIRRVRASPTGSFECRLDLSGQEPGTHHVEVRVQVGHRTERLQIPFIYETAAPPDPEPPLESDQLDESDEIDWDFDLEEPDQS